MVEASSVASTLIQEYTDRIVSSGIDPLQLARKLYSKQILNHNDYETIIDRRSNQSSSERLQSLLLHVSSAINCDGTVFDSFVEILNSIGGIASPKIAKELESEYRKRTLCSPFVSHPVSTNDIKGLFEKVIEDKRETLTSLLQPQMSTFAVAMAGNGLISIRITDNPDYDTIMRQFIGVLGFESDLSSVLARLNNFFIAMSQCDRHMLLVPEIIAQMNSKLKEMGLDEESLLEIPDTLGVVQVTDRVLKSTGKEIDLKLEGDGDKRKVQTDSMSLESHQSPISTAVLQTSEDKPVMVVVGASSHHVTVSGGNNVKNDTPSPQGAGYSVPTPVSHGPEGSVIDNTSDIFYEAKSESH